MRSLVPAAALAALTLAVAGAAAQDPGPGSLRARGVLRAEADLSLTAEGGGRVLSVERYEGESVEAGEAVVVLDDEAERSRVVQATLDLESAELGLKKMKDGPRPEDIERVEALLKEAEAGLALAERTLEADRELHAGGFLSELSRQRSERALEAARAQVAARSLDQKILEKGAKPEDIRLHEIEVERRRAILADRRREAERRRMAGRREGRAFVARIWVVPGQKVEHGQVVAELVYMDRVKVEIDLPAADGLRVAPGTPARIRSPRFGDVVLEGKVARISPVIDPASETIHMVVVADNPDLAMRPGVEAEVEIQP